MSILAYNDVRERKVIIYEDQPYEVMTSHVFRKQQRKPVNATKLKNLITGRVVEVSFQVSDKVEEADIEKRPVKFIYASKGEYWFHPDGKPAERFTLSADLLGDQVKWLKPNDIVSMKVFSYEDEEKNIGVEIPVKIAFKVKEAAPAVKGNTAQGAMKVAVLENGTEINVPLFINEGDSILVNTETGEYVERSDKS
jgi:elongation factor P